MDYLHENYTATIERISNLLSHHEITFSLLYALLVPRTILITKCRVSGALRCLKLLSATKEYSQQCGLYYDLSCESVDVIDEDPTSSELMIMPPDSLSLTGAGAHFGRAEHSVGLPYFEGTIKIHELRIYPLQYHPQSEKVKEILVARGRKWASLSGIHHMQYKGTGFRVLERGIQRCNVGFNLLLVHSVVISCRSAVEITNHD